MNRIMQIILTNSYKFLQILTNSYKFFRIFFRVVQENITWKFASLTLLQDVHVRAIELLDARVSLSLDWEQKQHSAEPQVIHPQLETPTWYSWRPDEDEVLSVWSFQTLTGKWQRWDTLYPWIYFVAQQERFKKVNMTISFRCWRALQSFQEGSNL
jgi:hypothetical protein